MSAHKKFVNELRKPVQKYNRKLKEEQRRKDNAAKTTEPFSEKRAQLLFDKLFSPLDDD